MTADLLSGRDSLFRYLVWRTVKAKGGAGVQAVDAGQTEQEAARQYALIMGTLEHPESADLIVGSETVEEAVAAIAAEYRGESEFEGELSAWGLDRAALARAVEQETRAGLLLDRIIADVSVSEEEVKDYYERNRERMQRPETRRVRHLLITVNDEFPENRVDQARARIQDLHRQIKEDPTRFAELALRHSECPSAVERGLVGQVPRGRLYPELDEALFRLQEGQVSEILETSVGYHLLLCESVHPGGTVAFDEAAPRIRKALKERRQKRRVRQWLSARKQGAD